MVRNQATIALVVIILVFLNAGKVYAVQTINVTPNTVIQGDTFQVSGGEYTIQAPDEVAVRVWSDIAGVCTGSVLNNIFTDKAFVDNSGNIGPIAISTSGYPIGVHCVETIQFSDGLILASSFVNVLEQAITTVTSTATVALTTVSTCLSSIGEYPYGLAILVFLTAIVYGIIRRRTSNPRQV